ncbi:hypothetical protein F5884DRAFT_899650 [Xylogone sp. PMI_703]|nr:hypothetical protein F5884DRAFT_899650 [Xylogone sp. PMI_703]
MAYRIAPYNPAMRLGMGFNSYTQQLCCNDIVRTAEGKTVTDADIKIASPELPQGGSSGPRHGILETQKGSKIIRNVVSTGADGQNEVSQVVAWHASFIDTASDATKKLNVSGALSVALDGLGSISVSGHYLDTNTLKESDATYNITVSVDNQRLVVPEMTEFYPIDHIGPSRFTEIYGDCFISGFVEGGLFNANIHLKKKKEAKEKDIGGAGSASLNVGGLDVKGEIKGGMTDNSLKENFETTISVTWSGGGDIKPNDVDEWDIKNLLRVAMEFPDRVAACPQKTYAILTKYTSLRSYYQHSLKGSPLDYENAGIYTNSLLDAYTDYKFIWSQIQERIAALDKNLITIYKLELHPSLETYRKTFIDTYTERKGLYDKAVALQKADPQRYGGVTLEAPLPPNALVAYTPDLFGLDQAKRDCRLEMIKIVREVSEVTRDPQVAADPTRVGRYVAPSIFRRLVPAEKPIDPTMAEREANAMRKGLVGTVHGTAQDLQNPRLYQTGDPMVELEKRVNMKYGHKSANWRIGQINGRSKHPVKEQSFNDLDVLDKTYVVSRITVWYDDTRIVGVQLKYQNGQVIPHGSTDGSNQSVSYDFQFQEKVCFIGLESHTDTTRNIWVDTMHMGSTLNIWVVEPPKRFKDNKKFEIKAPRPSGNDSWDLKGFYGSFDPKEKGFTQLGPIWGKEAVDEPTPAACSLFDAVTWPTVQDWPLSIVDSMKFHHHRGDNFRISPLHGLLANSIGTPFNALDSIDTDWIFKKASFFFIEFSGSVILSGVSVDYMNGKQLQYGKCNPSAKSIISWEPGLNKREVVVGIATSIQKKEGGPQYCLGLRLRLEMQAQKPMPLPKEESQEKLKEEKQEEEKEKKDEQKDEKKVEEENEENKTEKKSEEEQKKTEEKSPPPPPVVSDLWITGDASIQHGGEPWQTISAAPSPKPGEKWAIKGFAGQAGSDGIEALMVVWGKQV